MARPIGFLVSPPRDPEEVTLAKGLLILCLALGTLVLMFTMLNTLVLWAILDAVKPAYLYDIP